MCERPQQRQHRAPKKRHQKKKNETKRKTKKKARASYLDFVCLGDALRDTDDEANLILDSFDDRVRRSRWRNVEHRRIRLRLPYGLQPPHPTPQVNQSRGTPYIRSNGSRTSRTEPNTGRPRCVWPALVGETPPTIFVPYANASLEWNVPCRA